MNRLALGIALISRLNQEPLQEERALRDADHTRWIEKPKVLAHDTGIRSWRSSASEPSEQRKVTTRRK
jgi:hypothetical protein